MDLKLTNETGDWILKAIGFLVAIFSFRWLIKIFSTSDGKPGLSLHDFLKLAAFLLFYVGIIAIFCIEATRTTEYHKFDALWMAFVITGLFSVLHMDDLLDKMKQLLELMIRLRMGEKNKGKSDEPVE